MTPQTDEAVRALIERLEKATEPDRGLDAEIALAVGPWTERHGLPGGPWVSKGEHHAVVEAPNYTASIDAALTLVPGGYCFGMENGGQFDVNPNTEAWLWPYNSDFEPDWRNGDEGYRSAPDAHRAVGTAPIALCIAALKARLAQKEKDQ